MGADDDDLFRLAAAGKFDLQVPHRNSLLRNDSSPIDEALLVVAGKGFMSSIPYMHKVRAGRAGKGLAKPVAQFMVPSVGVLRHWPVLSAEYRRFSATRALLRAALWSGTRTRTKGA
jgi:hypothetical protein